MKYNYKIGDKVVYIGDDEQPYFEKYKEYTIVDVNNFGYLWFNHKGNTIRIIKYVFKTKKDLRKQKINKILDE
jgi:hypothetical protein